MVSPDPYHLVTIAKDATWGDKCSSSWLPMGRWSPKQPILFRSRNSSKEHDDVYTIYAKHVWLFGTSRGKRMFFRPVLAHQKAMH